MRRRAIERLVVIIAVASMGSACEGMMDVEYTNAVFYTLTGRAAGVLEPVALRLEFTGGSENLSITDDGEFSFEARLEPGDMYYVRFLNDPPCVLDEGRSGVITDENPEMTLTCKGAMTSRAPGAVTGVHDSEGDSTSRESGPVSNQKHGAGAASVQLTAPPREYTTM
jgi:hypothetical protein